MLLRTRSPRTQAKHCQRIKTKLSLNSTKNNVFSSFASRGGLNFSFQGHNLKTLVQRLGPQSFDFRASTALLLRPLFITTFTRRMLYNTKGITRVPVPPIPKDKLTVTFNTSSGPGGQNVNKVNTKAEIRFDPTKIDWLTGDVLTRFQHLARGFTNKEGEVVFSSQRYRTQKDNLEDCYNKLQQIVNDASIVPKEREETVAPEYAKEERIKVPKAFRVLPFSLLTSFVHQEKKIRSDIKKHRGKDNSGDWQ